MTKKELAQQIAGELGIGPTMTLEVVRRTFDKIVETLVNEGRIELRDFGVFRVSERKARKARNPRTGEAVSVPERVVVTFKPGREMLERGRKSRQLPDES